MKRQMAVYLTKHEARLLRAALGMFLLAEKGGSQEIQLSLLHGRLVGLVELWPEDSDVQKLEQLAVTSI